ncbi:MAG: hypothetical protein PHC34_04405 [Candidatus Gastranaerophilales bacterium]|nr:hypothetical protein [Candidatus Gastranaerophilales bacterium]
MKKMEEEIRNVVEIIEQIYSLEVSDMSKRMENLKRINFDSVAAYIEKEQKNNNFKSRNDLVKYIQSIIHD